MPSIMPQQVQGPSQGSDADHVVVERVVDMLIGTEGYGYASRVEIRKVLRNKRPSS